jgi:hypothetical protein
MNANGFVTFQTLKSDDLSFDRSEQDEASKYLRLSHKILNTFKIDSLEDWYGCDIHALISVSALFTLVFIFFLLCFQSMLFIIAFSVYYPMLIVSSEDYGQLATYNGTMGGHASVFALDMANFFPVNVPVKVSGTFSSF